MCIYIYIYTHIYIYLYTLTPICVRIISSECACVVRSSTTAGEHLCDRYLVPCSTLLNAPHSRRTAFGASRVECGVYRVWLTHCTQL